MTLNLECEEMQNEMTILKNDKKMNIDKENHAKILAYKLQTAMKNIQKQQKDGSVYQKIEFLLD